MKTKITYYAEKIASGSLSAYQASLHFKSLEQFRKVLERAEIIKYWNDYISADNCLKNRQINCAWKEFYNLLNEEWADAIDWGYYNFDVVSYFDHFTIRTNVEEGIWDYRKAELEAMGIPSDRQLWICRQARKAAQVFHSCGGYSVPHLPYKAYKSFFDKYNIRDVEIDVFWAEYYLNAINVFN